MQILGLIMDRNALYFHFANLGLIIIGILSIHKELSPIITAVLILGVICGFLFSWYMKNSKLPHIDTFIGMLSLASVVVVLSNLYEIEINFENLLIIFSTALVWLSLFQSFGLRAQKSYSMIQFISAALLISSVSLALEAETVYVLYLMFFLFILIFTMRLALVCEKQSKGSLIIGDKDEVMSLWHQIKVGAIMFSIILILSALAYPAVPRFNSLSLSWIPSSLLTLPEYIPLLKILKKADKTVTHKKKAKEQLIDGIKKREVDKDKSKDKEKETPKMSEAIETKKDMAVNKIEPLATRADKKETTERFQASGFKKDMDVNKIESLEISASRYKTIIGLIVALTAELKLADGSTLLATKLVDWKVVGTARVSIDKDGNLTPKDWGSIHVSASYMGTFSNELDIKIIAPPQVKPKKKRGFLFYLIIFLLLLIVAAMAIFFIIAFIISRKLAAMRRNDPRKFIKEVYYVLCKAFKVYGILKFNYTAYREFYNLAKELIAKKPGPMQDLTEDFLEASFSTHEISAEHTQKAIESFHEVKDVILEREEQNIFWKNTLFRFCVLGVILVPRRTK